MAQTVNTRQLMLESATFRSTVTETVIATPTFSEFIKLESTGLLSPSSITLNAAVYNTTNPSYSWERRSNDPTVTDWTVISGANTSTLVISNSNYLTYLGNGTQVSFRVTSKDSVNVDVLSSTATQIITYNDESKSSLVVTTSSPNTIIVTDVAGTPISLTGTGTKIQVSLNGTLLSYAASGASTWSIGTPTQSPASSVTLGSGSITDNNLSYTYGNITGLTADEVTVTYPITVRNSQGIARNVINTTQKFVKNKPGSTYELTISGGIRSFTYDQAGANPSPAATAYSAALTQNGNTVTPTSYSWTAGGQLGGTSTSATFTPTVNSAFGNTNTFVQCAVVHAGTTVTRSIPISINKVGTPGTKSITISAFKWSNSGAGSYTQAFTYTWSNGAVSAYPSGWTSSAPASPGTGYTLYQINLTITAPGLDTTTTSDWSSATTNTIGYRQDGSIGPQGAGHRTAYVVNTSSTVPGAVTAGTGDVVPTSAAGTWSFQATSNLAAGQYMYQVDGVYDPITGNITWGNPYLSNLKVGSLSALSADLGVVQISTTGSLASTGKAYGGATAGFFLGYSGTAYKFDIGNNTKYLRWTGTDLNFTGDLTGASGTFSGNLDVAGSAIFTGEVVGGSFGNANLRCGNLVNDYPTGTKPIGIIASGTDRGAIFTASGTGTGTKYGLYSDCTKGTNGVAISANVTGAGGIAIQANAGGLAPFGIKSYVQTDNGTGVHSRCEYSGGIGVYGAGALYGVHAVSGADAGIGVYAQVTASGSGTNPIGLKASSSHLGIEVTCTTTTGSAIYATNSTGSLARLATGGYSFYGDTGILHNLGEIRSNGNVIGGYSDIRLKTNIKSITSALDKVGKLTGFTYNPNDLAKSFGITDEPSVGLSAQELEMVLPEAVKMAPFDITDKGTSKSGDNYKTIQYERVVPLLVEAIKELQQEVLSLKKQIRNNNGTV
jgi:hypothetical protein